MRIFLNTVKAAYKHIFTTKVTTRFGKKCLFTPMDFEKHVYVEAIPYVNRVIKAKDYGLVKGFSLMDKASNTPGLQMAFSTVDDIFRVLC